MFVGHLLLETHQQSCINDGMPNSINFPSGLSRLCLSDSYRHHLISLDPALRSHLAKCTTRKGKSLELKLILLQYGPTSLRCFIESCFLCSSGDGISHFIQIWKLGLLQSREIIMSHSHEPVILQCSMVQHQPANKTAHSGRNKRAVYVAVPC
jgi:hypothetical protein